ncbi:MAG: lipopolysaccharide transport periplasmic protein LptA [Gammaproteobacteria bacterium]|nr:lipopolysaccharide transport periplasmic protein LptA [Gammaproteobacteria bacterium]
MLYLVLNRALSAASLCLILIVPAYALQSDRQQEVYVEADTADLDEVSGIGIYRGDVLIKQGTMEIRGDEVTIKTKDRKFSSLTSVGMPAKFQQQLELNQSPVFGDAKHIHYSVVDGILTLRKEAKLTRDGDIFTGNYLRYDTVNEKVKARRAEDGSERIKIIIRPETLNKSEPAQ